MRHRRKSERIIREQQTERIVNLQHNTPSERTRLDSERRLLRFGFIQKGNQDQTSALEENRAQFTNNQKRKNSWKIQEKKNPEKNNNKFTNVSSPRKLRKKFRKKKKNQNPPRDSLKFLMEK